MFDFCGPLVAFKSPGPPRECKKACVWFYCFNYLACIVILEWTNSAAIVHFIKGSITSLQLNPARLQNSDRTCIVAYAAYKVCSPLSSSFGLSAPYLCFVFCLRALEPAIMAVSVSWAPLSHIFPLYHCLSLQRVKNLYHMFKNCCRPVCIDQTFNNCLFLVNKWSVMEKQVTSD